MVQHIIVVAANGVRVTGGLVVSLLESIDSGSYVGSARVGRVIAVAAKWVAAAAAVIAKEEGEAELS